MKRFLVPFVAVPAALVLLPVLARAQEGRIRHVQPPGLENNPRYSHAVVVDSGPLVFVSGQVAHDAQGRLVGKGDMRAQTRQVFENLKAALAAAGSDFAHVVRINSYLTDMSQLDAHRQVRQEFLAGLSHPPASTLVGVARLVDPDLLLEVEAVAVVAEPSKSIATTPTPVR
jgi:enamine deaminase RidA (YjgF/YER057c/UK114 family)